MAQVDTKGQWKLVPHLSILNRQLIKAARCANSRLLVTMPPRHGKSWLTSCYFPAWFLGVFPDKRIILSSYEADFAATWGRKARDVLERQGEAFGAKVRQDSKAANRWDLAGHFGGMVTAGVGGPITGKGADVFLIDDPVKNAEEAVSETVREKTWDWYLSTAYTRLEPGGSVILIQTRWHTDDLAGRVLEAMQQEGEQWQVLNLPALAEEEDLLGRRPGEALWPERYGVDRLKEIRRTLGEYWFSSLYQQRPIPLEGGLFKASYFNRRVKAAPYDAKRILYIDRASTENGGCATAMVLMAKDAEGSYFVEKVVSGHWEPYERNQEIVAFARYCRTRYGPSHEPLIYVEAEGGSTNKDAWLGIVRALEGFRVQEDRVSGKKEIRAEPYATQCASGNVTLVEDGSWDINAYISELCSFPLGKLKDRVDASSGAFNLFVNRMVSGPVLRTFRLGGRKPVGLRIILCTEAQLAGLVLEQRCLLVVARNAGSGQDMSPHGLHKLQDSLILECDDIQPAELQDDWQEPPEVALFSTAMGKSLWSRILRKRTDPLEAIVLADGGNRIAESIGLAVCDLLGLERGKCLYRLGQDDWQSSKETKPVNAFIHSQVRLARSMVV